MDMMTQGFPTLSGEQPTASRSSGLSGHGVRHGFFGRRGGVSTGLYASLNCGFGSGDRADDVARNRARCAASLGVEPRSLVTVHQVHGIAVAEAKEAWSPDAAPRADAIVTARPGIALGILTADCAPILLADPSAGIIGAAHAGWKGAKAGVAEAVVAAMRRLGAAPERIAACVGPTIGRHSYEVGSAFKAAFLAEDLASELFFSEGPGCHEPPSFGEQPESRPYFDLQGFVVARLKSLGLALVDSIDSDTCADADHFFSYRRSCHRREQDYGRQLSAITIGPPDRPG